jgi:hypothetical protein
MSSYCSSRLLQHALFSDRRYISLPRPLISILKKKAEKYTLVLSKGEEEKEQKGKNGELPTSWP